MCYLADDPRLATLPHPEVLSRVKSDPLDAMPLPPPSGRIPPHVQRFEDGIKPWAQELIHTFNREMAALLRWLLDPKRAGPKPTVRDVYLDVTAMEPWLAALVSEGHVVEHDPAGGLRIRDASVTPDTHLNRAYMLEMSSRSEDFALWDAMLTHGVSYLADLAPQIILMSPLNSLEDGVMSVHTELARLVELGWYEVLTADDGDLLLPSVPCRCIKQGCVDRAGAERGRFRRIADNGACHGTHLTLGGHHPVVSTNSRCSVKRGSKRLSLARYTPAIRRPLQLGIAGLPPAGRMSSAHPVAPPPELRGIAAKRAAKGLPACAPQPDYVTWGAGTWSFPVELKAMLMEILVTVCILRLT